MQRKLAASCNPTDTITIDGDKVNISFNGKIETYTDESHFFLFDRRSYSKFTPVDIYSSRRHLLTAQRTIFF